jgi:hypothetical protein
MFSSVVPENFRLDVAGIMLDPRRIIVGGGTPLELAGFPIRVACMVSSTMSTSDCDSHLIIASPCSDPIDSVGPRPVTDSCLDVLHCAEMTSSDAVMQFVREGVASRFLHSRKTVSRSPVSAHESTQSQRLLRGVWPVGTS